MSGEPAPVLAPLLQWPGSGQGARLMAQHIQVVLEVQHLLAAAVAALVAGNPPPALPDLDMQRMHPRLHPAARPGGHRGGVGLDREAATIVPKRAGALVK